MPSKAKEFHRASTTNPDSHYAEFWQKERSRREKLDQEAVNPDRALGPGKVNKDTHTQTAAIFIPLTRLGKCKGEYYSASDPEWQEFVALSKDPERMRRINSRLADIVCQHTNNTPIIARVLGKPLVLSATWLDFKFPQSAPAEYERGGILWADNHIKWVAKRYDDRQAQRFYRIIFPTALLSSLQGFSSTFLTSRYGALRGLWSRAKSSERQSSTEMSVAASPIATPRNEAKSSSLASMDKGMGEPQPRVSLAETPAFHSKVRDILRDIIHGPRHDSAFVAAATSFRVNFANKWTKSLRFDTRGACLVKGEIAMNGPNGRCKVYIEALYLPKENIFTHILLKDFDHWMNNQAPRGRSKSGKSAKS